MTCGKGQEGRVQEPVSRLAYNDVIRRNEEKKMEEREGGRTIQEMCTERRPLRRRVVRERALRGGERARAGEEGPADGSGGGVVGVGAGEAAGAGTCESGRKIERREGRIGRRRGQVGKDVDGQRKGRER